MNKESQNYRDTLINAYKDGELSIEDFINTLDHYADLIKKAPNIRAEREKIAAMAMCAVISTMPNNPLARIDKDGIVAQGVQYADKLINELNKES